MHELALAQNAVELIEAAAQREGFAHARVVRFEIGVLACVEPDALRFAFESASLGSCAQGARIEIVELYDLDGAGCCPACGQLAAMQTLYDLCPCCEAAALRALKGQEMRIRDLEVE